jgi:hypothetical protein
MEASLPELLHGWHDFLVIVGTASATLVGLMFVAASIGANVFNEGHGDALKAFITPTVVHFSAVLFICAIEAVPSHTWLSIGCLLAAAGVTGIVYSGRIILQLVIRHRFEVDMVDRLFYALLPWLGYLLLLAAAVMLLMRLPAAPNLVAAAVITLLLAGIRNGWDMTIWIVMRTPTPPQPPR